MYSREYGHRIGISAEVARARLRIILAPGFAAPSRVGPDQTGGPI